MFVNFLIVIDFWTGNVLTKLVSVVHVSKIQSAFRSVLLVSRLRKPPTKHALSACSFSAGCQWRHRSLAINNQSTKDKFDSNLEVKRSLPFTFWSSFACRRHEGDAEGDTDGGDRHVNLVEARGGSGHLPEVNGMSTLSRCLSKFPTLPTYMGKQFVLATKSAFICVGFHQLNNWLCFMFKLVS